MGGSPSKMPLLSQFRRQCVISLNLLKLYRRMNNLLFLSSNTIAIHPQAYRFFLLDMSRHLNSSIKN